MEDIITSSFPEWTGEPALLRCGILMVCREGTATINVNFKEWTLVPGAVITLFPNEGVMITSAEAFKAEALLFSPDTLREASLSLENAVYESLHHDRCRTESENITDIVNHIFHLLKQYRRLASESSFQQIVMYQLRVFFLGFADYIKQHPVASGNMSKSPRRQKHFNAFMQDLETHFMEHHDVAFYASQLCMTPRYLHAIVKEITHQSAKDLIDGYIILQLKLALRTSHESIGQLAWKYHFSTQCHLTRFFKVHTGMTPKEYINPNSSSDRRL